MRISEQGLDFIKSFEGLELEAYWDKRGGVWTIGWGHTRGVKKGQVITKEQAEQFILDDLAPIEKHLSADLASDNVTQHEFDALCSFCFNIRDGIRQYMGSTLRRKLKAGDKLGAANEFPRWCHAGGVAMNGLKRRRNAERKMFLQSGQADIAALLLGMMLAGATVLVAMIFVM